MPISWFPGHMVTARKAALVAMGRTDVVIEVLDARVPHSSCNPLVETLRRQNRRPALKLLNKSDLADPAHTRAWLAHYNGQPGVSAVAISARNSAEVNRIPAQAQALAPERGTAARPLRMMILGIPNVGKSTLMNALLRRHVAAVGDQPAITKMHMGHALGPGMWLIDTPGLLWPGVSEQRAMLLAATHSIGTNAYDDEVVAVALGDYLLAHYRAQVVARLGPLPADADGHRLLAEVARTRGLLAKEGLPDLHKAAVVLLNEFRDGLLGRITLETVANLHLPAGGNDGPPRS
ncbi:MAG: ribosome biogenesis GTPase YlqF [Myxococcales bacterium]